ncbi:MAG: arginyltransferase [Rhodobacteraceae bacterium]|nr:MAG: arginyltransferase [Paracoccaceae bacterium]
MSHHQQKIAAQFFLTATQPCPYLPDREERKVFTTLRGRDAAAVNDELSLRGFRRSQSVAYRPSCPNCSSCLSTRIPVADFEPTRSQRRVARRNADLVRRACAPWATEEQYQLFRRYLDARHADGGMAEMDAGEFAAMIEETPVRSRIVEYHDRTLPRGETLVAACLTDVTTDGLSMVYSFFDPALADRSLGGFMILDHIEIAREAALPYVYLGYWVPGSPKMHYKAAYRPFEVYLRGRWRRMRDAAEAVAAAPKGPAPFDPL